MGLDNIPKSYPCKTQGKAVMVDDQIDCKATQACGGCPYVTELDKQDKTLLGNPVYGMFGTDCWYRGKWGNHLLEMSDGLSEELSFYGDNEDGTEKSPESCELLADHIGELISEQTDKNGHLIAEGEDIAPDLRYAEWYLRWASEFCDGLMAWY
jgi:hypothetical protein